jgi:diguanylate cyclase (GGDEF)-like protein
MTLRSTPSVRSRLILLVVACIVPATLVTVSLIWYDYERARDELINNSILAARAVATMLDQEFSTVESTLQALATSPSLAARDLAAFHAQADAVVRQRQVLNIVLANADGRQFLNTLLPRGAPLPQGNLFSPLKHVSATRTSGISELFTGPVSRRPTIAIGIPVARDGATYILGASMSSDRYAKLLSQQSLPPDWIATILDQRGTVVARNHAMAKFAGKHAESGLARNMAATDEGAFEGTTLDGTAVFAAFSRAPKTRWTVAIGVPTASLDRELNLRVTWLAIATSAVLAFSVVLAWFIGGRIARAVRGLALPAHALGEGRRVEFEATKLRETDEVGHAIVKASNVLRQTRYRADHDVLTGLANRAQLQALLDEKVALGQRNATYLAILYLDLDGFKSVNDQHGHAMGDQLLQIVAHRLKSLIRTSDLIARLGGDEFVVVLAGAPAREAAQVAGKLIDSLGAPYRLGGVSVTISASIGIAQFPASGRSASELMQRADAAMYAAKLDGKGRYAFAPGAAPPAAPDGAPP